MMGQHQVVGKIKEAHGLKGESYILLFAQSADWLGRVALLGLGPTPDAPTEWVKFSKPRASHAGLITRLGETADRTQAEALLGKFVFVPTEALVSKAGETPYLRELLGFEVLDRGNPVGRVLKFASNGPQDLLVVSEREHLIPLVEAFLERIDFENQKIHMKLPEGLIEIDDEEKA